jgi:hypothetical protein
MDRLPDARQRAVPALLAERDFREGRVRELGGVVGRAIDANLDLVRTGLEERRHLECEWQKSAFVVADQLPIHPHAGVMKHRAEMQPHAVGDPVLGKLDGAAIDADAGAHAQVGELRLPGARHRDGAHLRRARQPVVGHVQKVPGAIKTDTGIEHDLSSGSRAQGQ